jgi:hypothetical protein
VRTSRAVAPEGLVATMLSTVVPPVSGTVRLKAPSGPAVVVWTVVLVLSSRLEAATAIELPGADVPATSTLLPTAELSAGEVTVSGVSCCACLT